MLIQPRARIVKPKKTIVPTTILPALPTDAHRVGRQAAEQGEAEQRQGDRGRRGCRARPVQSARVDAFLST